MPPATRTAHPQFSLLCGAPAIQQMIAANLQAHGFTYDPHSPITLLLDAPYGFALKQLEMLDQTDLHVVVVTNNFSPEYCEDVAALQPAILLVSHCLHQQVENALIRAAQGEHYHLMPPLKSTLTPTERTILRYAVRDYSNKEIAAHLNVRAQTVANALSSVYAKLGVKGRVGAAFHYWGRPDLLVWALHGEASRQ